ncbi:hypothetical protein AAMO2058_001673500 [Amorphochlora amoebiformis]
MGNQACCGNPKWRGKEARDEEESSYSDNGTISSAGFPGDENFPALPGVVVETIYHHKTKSSKSHSPNLATTSTQPPLASKKVLREKIPPKLVIL